MFTLSTCSIAESKCHSKVAIYKQVSFELGSCDKGRSVIQAIGYEELILLRCGNADWRENGTAGWLENVLSFWRGPGIWKTR